MNDNDYDFRTLDIPVPLNLKRLKILLIGDMKSGKSSIIKRYVDNKFSKNIERTIAFDFKLKSIRNLEKHICLHIWDISGSKKYKWLLHQYIKEVDAIIFVCDVKQKKSIYNIMNHWYYILRYRGLDSFMYVAVNKCDLIDNKENLIMEIEFFFKEIADINNIFYISALSNKGITKMFSQIINDIVKPKNQVNEVNILEESNISLKKQSLCILI